ncbi:methyl-accepting chemotaxis protein [Vibrio coralliilyticus]|uniref:methyl-accepting chemotaxis protein n=1 Tax=Vibrio coralliilyticus TaxID=190893 RepID=UPI001300C9C3|nr:methyl-accepting chemotaxis protein [Vibrio coralliilyticus]
MNLFQASMEEAGKLSALVLEEYQHLPWLYEEINDTDTKVLSDDELDLTAKNNWQKARAELFIESTQIQTYFAELMKDYNPESREKLQQGLDAMLETIQRLNNQIVNDNIGISLTEYRVSVSDVNDLNAKLANISDEVSEMGLDLRVKVSELASLANQRAGEASDTSLVLINETQTTLVGALIVSALLAASIGYFCASAIKTNLMKLQFVIQSVSQGELFNKTHMSSKNEIGMLCSNTDSTVDSLSQTVDKLRNVGTEVSSSSTELASVMTQLEANSMEQKAQVELIASAITELATSSTQVAASAQAADQNAKSVIDITNIGVESAQHGVELSTELTRELSKTSNVASSLQELSENVSGFVSMIENVAEQTNLLALNAAIEAARAGESGRGFAVVADEVRVLAQRTAESTGSIQELVVSLQTRATEMTDSVGGCIEKVEQASTINQQTREQLTTIADEISHISMNNNEMASAADEQSRAIVSINENIEGINEALTQNVTGISQSTEAASYLSELSENQSLQLQFFRTAS